MLNEKVEAGVTDTMQKHSAAWYPWFMHFLPGRTDSKYPVWFVGWARLLPYCIPFHSSPLDPLDLLPSSLPLAPKCLTDIFAKIFFTVPPHICSSFRTVSLLAEALPYIVQCYYYYGEAISLCLYLARILLLQILIVLRIDCNL